MVFQDYTTSANPRFRIRDVLMEGIRVKKRKTGKIKDPAAECRRLLELVGLDETFLDRFPHELSGGQLQRVCIASCLLYTSAYANFNTINVTKNCANKELAYEYINYRISEELQTKTGKALNEAPTNMDVTFTEEESKDMTYGDKAAKEMCIRDRIWIGIYTFGRSRAQGDRSI